MVYEYVSPQEPVEEDALPARRVDVPVRTEDERAAAEAHVDAVGVEEGSAGGLGTANDDFVFVSWCR